MSCFDIVRLSEVLESGFPEIEFALLFGSSVDGNIAEGSDVDIAVRLNCPATYDFYKRFYRLTEEVVGGAVVDVSILNDANPVLCFEAIKGKLLFARDSVDYPGFFSLTCRLYENQMYRYEYQRRQVSVNS